MIAAPDGSARARPRRPAFRDTIREGRALIETIRQPVPVPLTLLFSGGDGLVAYSACLDPAALCADAIEITGRHVTIASNPQVFDIIAARLAR